MKTNPQISPEYQAAIDERENAKITRALPAAAHTPTPASIPPLGELVEFPTRPGVIYSRASKKLVCETQHPEHAREIIRAVNAHEALVAALEQCEMDLGVLRDCIPSKIDREKFLTPIIARISSALALAKD